MKVGDRYGGERIVVVEDPRAAPRRPKPKVVTSQATVRVRRVVPAAPSGGPRLRSLMRLLEHEMRTPLATSLIQLSAVEAAMGDVGALDSAKAALAGAARQIRTLSLIVRRAVEIESEQPIVLFPQRVDLGQLVTDFLVRLRATGLTLWSRIEVKMTKALVGSWDPAAIEQILENLLSNALKFGEGGPVVLTVAPDRGGARLSVRDAGVGIDLKDRERIFARFERGPSARGIAGLGIGLWVVRHLIRAHGGSVLVRSRPGKWTVFDVWLPQLALYPISPMSPTSPASRSLSSAACSAPALDRRGSKGPMRKSPCSAAKRTRSPTL
jgi:signal transduction histidine kinase